MHKSVQNFINIENKNNNSSDLNINNQTNIAVSKTFKLEKIMPLIDFGHTHFGENKVQEVSEKCQNQKENLKIKLHMIGKLQTNKVKLALLFDYIIFDKVKSLRVHCR